MPLGANKAAIMGVAGTAAAGDVVLIDTITATSDATISFTSGIDSTYGEYIFKFYNCNPETDGAYLTFQGSIDGGDNYNVAMTTTFFQGLHDETASANFVLYQSAIDQAEGAIFQELVDMTGNGADESCVGELHLFNPSSTTYVKHFISETQNYSNTNQTINAFIGGYFNTTSAINAIQYKFSAGDFDGTIKMWGVK